MSDAKNTVTGTNQPKPGQNPTKAVAPAAPAASSGETKKRKTPVKSGRPPLHWDGLTATAKNGEGKVLMNVEIKAQGDGKFQALYQLPGKKWETLAENISDGRAYYALVAFYHRDERPVVRKATAKKVAAKKTSAA